MAGLTIDLVKFKFCIKAWARNKKFQFARTHFLNIRKLHVIGDTLTYGVDFIVRKTQTLHHFFCDRGADRRMFVKSNLAVLFNIEGDRLADIMEKRSERKRFSWLTEFFQKQAGVDENIAFGMI